MHWGEKSLIKTVFFIILPHRAGQSGGWRTFSCDLVKQKSILLLISQSNKPSVSRKWFPLVSLKLLSREVHPDARTDISMLLHTTKVILKLWENGGRHRRRVLPCAFSAVYIPSLKVESENQQTWFSLPQSCGSTFLWISHVQCGHDPYAPTGSDVPPPSQLKCVDVSEDKQQLCTRWQSHGSSLCCRLHHWSATGTKQFRSFTLRYKLIPQEKHSWYYILLLVCPQGCLCRLWGVFSRKLWDSS